MKSGEMRHHSEVLKRRKLTKQAYSLITYSPFTYFKGEDFGS